MDQGSRLCKVWYHVVAFAQGRCIHVGFSLMLIQSISEHLPCTLKAHGFAGEARAAAVLLSPGIICQLLWIIALPLEAFHHSARVGGASAHPTRSTRINSFPARKHTSAYFGSQMAFSSTKTNTTPRPARPGPEPPQLGEAVMAMAKVSTPLGDSENVCNFAV